VKNFSNNDNLYFLKQQEQKIYDRFLHLSKTEEPESIIRRFHSLFIQATGYEEPEIRAAVENIVNSPNAEAEFTFFLNRCFHIIINRWQMQPNLKSSIPELIAEIELALPPGDTYSRSTRKLRKLVRDFQETEQYIKLQRLARLIDEGVVERPNHRQSVGNLIQRYPYLHEHCLLSEDSSFEFKQTVKEMQTVIQNRYELDLSKYITYRVRSIDIIKKYKAANQTKIPKKVLNPVDNPTLLSDRELDRALRHYMGKVENGRTYRDLSCNFLTHTSQVNSFKAFKDDLYEYIISGVDSKYGKHKFNQKLYNKLQTTLPDFDRQKPNEFLQTRTFSEIFKLLVVDSKASLNHYMFVDLISNLGETQVIGLLLKLVLLCQKVRPYLEKRFSILFSHYESFTKDGVSWLVTSLENLQIAFSIHFGQADFSLVKII
jgi:hypothetical protein